MEKISENSLKKLDNTEWSLSKNEFGYDYNRLSTYIFKKLQNKEKHSNSDYNSSIKIHWMNFLEGFKK